ncbi:hypothetical protein HYDPIDRAFT_37904 [Hydnomerulius pinastri MD-312]|nr:hypothetical protein HYDPIDRAFT_37904 [Hydnomerulius pinastri MD-312]
MDDDVQYLGTKFATHEPLDNPCEAQEPVSGIILHVEKCGEKAAHEITFHRSRSSYVNIGRKSGSDDKSMRKENDDHNAVFACQVVSARHAKMVLSDSGQVYVVDLHSRHGTHLLKRGESSPRMLKPEVETALADGDILTFGKAVGAGSYLVSPVTIRVELLRDGSSSRASPPARPLTPISSLSHLVSRNRKLSSGRYGLFVPPSYPESVSPHSTSSMYASSDGASSPSEHDSDIEEISSCVPSLGRDSQDKSSQIKIPTFRSFIHDMCNNNASRLSAAREALDASLADTMPSPSSSVEELSQPSPVVVVIDPTLNSRSQSPMELSTPSPSPPSEAQNTEPPVIGAWPDSRPESPDHSSIEAEAPKSDIQPDVEIAHPLPCLARLPDLFPDNLSNGLMDLPPPPFFPVGGPFSNSIASDFGLPPSMPPFPPHGFPAQKALVDRIGAELKASVKRVEEQVTTLQETVTDLKSRHSLTEEDVMDLQTHVDMLEPESDRLLCRINLAERNIASLSGLQTQVNTLRNRLDAPEPEPLEAPLSDVRACAEALNTLVSEMKSLREDAEKRIEEKIDAINVARAEALSAIATEVETLNSLKRKRTEKEDEPQTSEDVVMNGVVAEVGPKPAPFICDEDAHEVPRPQKRARTAMHTAAHTAAAMAVGAVATWSALAFS